MIELAPAELWTAAQAAAADRHTIEALGVPSPVLMERAALCVSAEVERVADACGATRVLVLVGPGNNGGDGLAVARQLHGRGRSVTAVLVTPPRNAAAEQQLGLARAHGVALAEELPELGPATVIVDALLGTGSRGAPRGAIEQALRWVAAQASPVVAIDLPSGIEVDTGAVAGVAARAQTTVTFQRSKVGLHLTPARALVGRVVVADIGLVEPPGEGAEHRTELIGPSWIAQQLSSLPSAAHKGSRGHVGVVGGTGGTPGAAVLTGMAALRAGAGLASLAVADEQLRRTLLEVRPELMLAEREDPWVASAGVLVVGPGLTDASRRAGLAELDRADRRPMVWDASALAELVPGASAGPRILTPHPGEAAQLLARIEGDPSWTSARVQADRRSAAEQLARACAAIVVLKGAGTIVARSVGERVQLAICTTGGPALATAGSGDVLAGAIAALLARGLNEWAATCVAVHVHGLAGDAAPIDGALALDVADGLPAALARARAAAAPGRWPSYVRG